MRTPASFTAVLPGRLIALDVETTGLVPERGDRVIEIACVELVGGRRTGQRFVSRCNPQGRKSHPEALAKHGITEAMLASEPAFWQIAPALLAFIGDAPVVAHNAQFDRRCLTAELARVQGANVRLAWLDTMEFGKVNGLPGRPGLAALAEALGIPVAGRRLHGALADATLVAELIERAAEQAAPRPPAVPAVLRGRVVGLRLETTGPCVADGHRVFDIACVEAIDGVVTERVLHTHVNPARRTARDTLAAHGITSAYLIGMPRFEAVAKDVLDFIGDARLVSANARADLDFLERELAAAGCETTLEVLDVNAVAEGVLDTRRPLFADLCQHLGVQAPGPDPDSIARAGMTIELLRALSATADSIAAERAILRRRITRPGRADRRSALHRELEAEMRLAAHGRAADPAVREPERRTAEVAPSAPRTPVVPPVAPAPGAPVSGAPEPNRVPSDGAPSPEAQVAAAPAAAPAASPPTAAAPRPPAEPAAVPEPPAAPSPAAPSAPVAPERSGAASEAGGYPAIAAARQTLEADPTATEALMAALAAYERCADRLRRALALADALEARQARSAA